MARSRKRHRSLFELMDPKGACRASSVAGRQEEDPAEPKPSVDKVLPTEPAVEDKKGPSAEGSRPEAAIEPFLRVGDEKVRLIMNYPLAIMLCFAVVILLICAALVGWRLGRDSVLKEMERPRPGISQEVPY